MSSGEESGEPPIGSLAWMESMKKKEGDLKSNKIKPQRIDEHLDLGQTIKEERRRQRAHPAGHGRRAVPFSTIGESSKAKDPADNTGD